jgi:hypothetical protein
MNHSARWIFAAHAAATWLALGGVAAAQDPATMTAAPASTATTTASPPATTPAITQTPAPVKAPPAAAASPAAAKRAAHLDAGEPRAQAGEPRAQASEPRAQAGEPRAQASDRVNLDTTTVTGNQELPKVMYIVPWKKSDIGDLAGKPMNSLLDEVLAPVDREVFRREVRYYDAVHAGAPQNGAAPPDASRPADPAQQVEK